VFFEENALGARCLKCRNFWFKRLPGPWCGPFPSGTTLNEALAKCVGK
jgi:hypothetical protein